MRIAVVLFAVLCSPVARAQVPTPTGVCVANCGSSSTSSGDGGAAARARAAEKTLYRQIDRENAAREKAKAKELAPRRANVRAMEAVRKKKWDKALKLLELAQRQHPGDSRIAANLAAIRVKIEAQRLARQAQKVARQPKVAPVTPPIETTPIETPAKPIAITAIAIGDLPAKLDEVVAPLDVVGWNNLAPAIDLRQVLDARRKGFQSIVPDAKDVTVGIAKSVGANLAGAGSIVSFRDRIQSAGQMKARYNQLARDLVDEATRATQEAASILGGGEGDTQHVLDAPQRMARIVNQFVSDELQGMIWGKIKGWGKGTARGLVQDAVRGGDAP